MSGAAETTQRHIAPARPPVPPFSRETAIRKVRLIEVVLSLGAINTPKVLMLSGIGDQVELQRLAIPVVQHLPGVGQNFQDHLLLLGCVWEHRQPEPVARREQAVLPWKSDFSLDTPDMLCVHGEVRLSAPRQRSSIHQLIRGALPQVSFAPRAEVISVSQEQTLTIRSRWKPPS
jgi:choline dehydrogenase-like flavoprotein